jgi:glycosyltransferase 2 family protein
LTARGSTRLLGGPVGLTIRLLVAGGLTAYLLRKVHPSEVLAATRGADWRPIAFAVLLVLADRTLMAYRWVALLCTLEPGQRPPIGALMRVFFESTFLGTFLPGSVGGDAVRSYGTARLNVPGGDAVASVFMDRMLGVASVLLMALVGLWIARDLASNTAVIAGLLVSAAACAVTMFVIFSPRGAGLAMAVAMRLPFAFPRRIGLRIVESIAKYAGHPLALVNVLGASVLVQVLRILQAYCLGLSLGIAASVTAYFAFIPLILLVMLLPITFNGLGTGQAAFVWAFGHAGVPQAPALALSFLFVALGILGNLPGAVLWIAGSRD